MCDKCQVRLSAILPISGDMAPENRSNFDAHTDSQKKKKKDVKGK
jgi:hypothetical protein